VSVYFGCCICCFRFLITADICSCISRTAAEITQFTTGLNELNLWNYVKKEPESFKPLFCYAPKPLTKETFFELCQPNFSDVGSNKRADEMDTIYSWELFLQDVEGTYTVQI
jgi:hypothetical protein